jgi:4-hydroxy-tetrahydrodipicolinate reductase
MGGLAQRLIADADDLELHAAIGSRDSLDALAGADIVFDLTVPAVSPDIVSAALDHGIPTLVGTSGWTAERIATLQTRVGADATPSVVIVPNFSMGSALATAFAVLAAPWFDAIEIVESHHAGKVDSPSGTAIRTAELIGKARAELGPVAAPHADQRARGQQVASVPIHSLRHAGVSARQEVVFGGEGETLRVLHDTLTDDSYAAGILLALRAVRDARGVVVGLDQLIDLGLPVPRSPQ